MTIGSLQVNIVANTNQFTKNVRGARGELALFQKAAVKIRRLFIGGILGGLGIGSFGGLLRRGIREIREAGKAIDQITDPFQKGRIVAANQALDQMKSTMGALALEMTTSVVPAFLAAYDALARFTGLADSSQVMQTIKLNAQVAQFQKRHKESGLTDPLGFNLDLGFADAETARQRSGIEVAGMMRKRQSELKRWRNSLIGMLPGSLQQSITGAQLPPAIEGLFQKIGSMIAKGAGLPGAAVSAAVNAAAGGAIPGLGARQPALESLVGGSMEAFIASRENMRPRNTLADPAQKTAINTKEAVAVLKDVRDGIKDLAANAASLIGAAIGG